MANSPDFPQRTIETLAKRAGQLCSKPNCQTITSRPHTDETKSINLGEAAHIKGARPGSMRYEPNMTDEQRCHISNGIWLCRIHAREIDTDEENFSVELLKRWKNSHETNISKGKLLTTRKFLDEIDYRTTQNIQKTQTKITGTGNTINREEVLIVENQLNAGNSVLITGEPGNGKSGVGVLLALRAKKALKFVLIIDARQVQHFQDENALRGFYYCEKPLAQEIAEIGGEKGFLLVIDQLDNVANERIANILINLAIECNDAQGVQVVVISRKRESYEARLLDKLLERNFVDIECRLLDDTQARKELEQLGFESPRSELITMCKNLLNLEILSNIKTQNLNYTFNEIEDEVTLWDAYLETVQGRESINSTQDQAERILSEAMKFAKEGLTSNKQEFSLDKPLSLACRRLESWGIIVNVEGTRYQFKHEKLQDYLYARFAADRGYLPQHVLNEVGQIKSRNALVWLNNIYVQRKSPLQIHFLEALFNGE